MSGDGSLPSEFPRRTVHPSLVEPRPFGSGNPAVDTFAEHLGCDPLVAYRALDPIGVSMVRSEVIARREPKRRIVAKIARRADELLAALHEMPDAWRASGAEKTGISCEALERLSERCRALVGEDPPSRQGGRDLEVHKVAEGMRRLYRRLRRTITFGVDAVARDPSTEFGRDLAFALEAFGLQADWEKPVRKALKKHRAVDERLQRRRDRSLEG